MDDKARMEKVDARNQLETYLYNTRNTVREDKVKESLGEDTVKEVEDWVQEGINWLDSYQEEDKATYDEKFKGYEDKIKPIMMKLYQNSGVSSEGVGPDGTKNDPKNAPKKGPDVDELD